MTYNISPKPGYFGHIEGYVRYICAALTEAAITVGIEPAGCHIASLPVAVNIECHSHRHKAATI